MNDEIAGPFRVVRVDQYSKDVFPVDEHLSLGCAIELAWNSTKPGRDAFFAINAEGDIVYDPLSYKRGQAQDRAA